MQIYHFLKRDLGMVVRLFLNITDTYFRRFFSYHIHQKLNCIGDPRGSIMCENKVMLRTTLMCTLD